MQELKLAFIGFGTVGQGFARLLQSKESILIEEHDLKIEVTTIIDKVMGMVVDPGGVDLANVLARVERDGKISNEMEVDSRQMIKDGNFDVLVEVSFTDIETAEPAISFIKAALQSGKHVISTNKGPPALAMKELEGLAKENGVYYRYEGTVLSGTPCLNLSSEAMRGVSIHSIRGILNGTCNYILEEMEQGTGYEQALNTAQELGYAEADPTADVEGFDAATKIVILANKLMNANLRVSDVDRSGIVGLTTDEIKKPDESGFKTKLIASAHRKNEKVNLQVGVNKLTLADPLANVNGVLNAATFSTDTLGDVTVIGPGAGSKATAQSLFSDLLAINDKLTTY